MKLRVTHLAALAVAFAVLFLTPAGVQASACPNPVTNPAELLCAVDDANATGGDVTINLAPGTYEFTARPGPTSSVLRIGNLSTNPAYRLTLVGSSDGPVIIDTTNCAFCDVISTTIGLAGLTVRNVEIRGNGGGYGIRSGARSTHIEGVTVTRTGHGVAFENGFLGGGDVTNSTLSDNIIGVDVEESLTVYLQNDTIASNAQYGLEKHDPVRSTNTLFVGNTTDCSSPLTSSSYDIAEADGSCGGRVFTWVSLGGLDWNGGPTRTQAITDSSSARDAGTNSGCPATDQRGQPRSDGLCDVGAYESQPLSAGNTPAGPNVHVDLLAGAVRVMFDQVDIAGDTVATFLGVGPSPPAGFQLGDPPVFYDLSTTATFSGVATVCISYAGIAFPTGTTPQLLHVEGGTWIDKTIYPIDTVNQIVCGRVTSFSPFAVFFGSPPTLTLPGNLTVEASGPTGANISYAVSAASGFDPAPAVVCDPPSGALFAFGKTVVTCTAKDSGFGVTTGTFDVTVTDTKAPDVSCASPDGAWHSANVSLVCTASDSGSGLANPSDASFSLTTSVAPGSETADASTDSRKVCDVALNCVIAGPIGGNKVDRRAPVLHVPPALVVNATSPAGAIVPFTATATDGTDLNPSVACVPASGSSFAVGTTIVACTATDHAGNTSMGTFTVKVKGAPEQIVDLVNELLAYLKQPALAAPLQTQLQSVSAALIQKRPAAACSALAAFIAVVQRVPKSTLTATQSQQLVSDATRIRLVIGC